MIETPAGVETKGRLYFLAPLSRDGASVRLYTAERISGNLLVRWFAGPLVPRRLSRHRTPCTESVHGRALRFQMV